MGSGAVSGGSGESVSLALPAWAPRLFGRGRGARRPEDDGVAQTASQELDAIESLRQSSVVVRAVVPPLANAADTPRFGPAAAVAASPERHGQAARRYTAELATTHRPTPPPPGPAPPEASPLGSALRLFGGQPGDRQQPQQHAARASSGADPQGRQLSSSQKLRGSLFADDDDDPEPTAPPQPPPGRFGWFRHQQPAVPAGGAVAAAGAGLPAAAAAGPLPAATWTASQASELSQQAGGSRLPPPPAFRAPSAASMHRFSSSPQQDLPHEAPTHLMRQVRRWHARCAAYLAVPCFLAAQLSAPLPVLRPAAAVHAGGGGQVLPLQVD
jgi:hypothetical protein